MADTLQRAWLRRGPLAWALSPVALVMRLLVAARRQAYRLGWLTSHPLPVPVVVVGNRVVGGAGKTPTTLAILAHLKAQGWHPGVLSRGYKARLPAAGQLLLDTGSGVGLAAWQTGDEPMLIWQRAGVPVMIGRDRVRSGHALLRAHPEIDILVCDDGLQHLRLRRDLEVVVFDTRGQGNGWLLPAGPLREPIVVPPSPGAKAPPVVLYNAAHPSTPLPGHTASQALAPLSTLADWRQGLTTPAQQRPAAGAQVWAVAGIAHPTRFFDALRAQGYQVEPLPLADHADLRRIPWPRGARHVLLTEKDAVKLDPAQVARERPDSQVWVAALDFRPSSGFWQQFDAALTTIQARHQPG